MTIAAPNARQALSDADDDTPLETRFARGEPAAFDEVVALYQARVTRLAARLLGWRTELTEDVAQDVFLTALSRARTFRGDASLWTWLTAITLNRCRSQSRRAAVVRRLMLGLAREPTPLAPASDEAMARSDESRRVREVVAGLPVKDREVVVLFYLEHRSAAEIAQMLGSSTNAVDVRLHRARQKLKALLQDVSAGAQSHA